MLSDHRFFFVDLETSGLDARKHDILEIGVLVVDQDLQELATWSRVIKHDLANVLFQREAYAMHKANGLIDEIPHGVSLESAITECRHFLFEHGIHKALGQKIDKAPMCGSSVHFDRKYLATYAPDIESLFSHRNIDVSSLTGVCRIWNPRFFDGLMAPTSAPTHRVLDDCRFSATLLGKFRAAFESLR